MREEKAAWAERKALKDKLLAVDEDHLIALLAANGMRLRGADHRLIDLMWGYDEGKALDSDQLRRVLTALVERIELDPKTRDFTIRYRLPVTGVKVASPRGFEPRLPP
jgi:hypothetical protein